MTGGYVGLNSIARKLHFLVKELNRYIAGVQETKWFGSDIWNANEYTLLHTGRPLPDASAPAVKNEGVGIELDERATAAWKEAGEK